MRTDRALGAVAVLGAALTLGGCPGVVAVNEPNYSQEYDNGELEYAARSGELKTDVYGMPFAGAGNGVVAATTANMKGANRGPVIAFTPTPRGKGSGGYHVVMLFNPVAWASAYDICKDGAGYAATPGKGRVRLLSAFCFSDKLVSTASGSVAGADRLDDPRFKALVREVTLALFPAYDYKDPNDGPSPES